MEEYKEIERSIIKRFRKEIYRPFVKAVSDFNLISDGDMIAVCISGGKDSFLLAKCLEELMRHGKINFSLKFILMNPGYSEEHLEKIKNNASKLNLDIHYFEFNVFEQIRQSQQNRKEPEPVQEERDSRYDEEFTRFEQDQGYYQGGNPDFDIPDELPFR